MYYADKPMSTMHTSLEILCYVGIKLTFLAIFISIQNVAVMNTSNVRKFVETTHGQKCETVTLLFNYSKALFE